MTRDPNDTSHLPPWLRDVALPARPPERADSAPAAPQSEIAPADAQALPPWLVDTPAESAANPAGAADDLPDWLRDQAPAGNERLTPPEPESQPLPSWLTSISGSSADTPAPEEREDVPDWLRELRPADEASSERAEAQPNVPAAQEMPDVPPPPAFDEPAAPAEPSPDADEIPNWLQNISDDEIQRVIDSDNDDDLGVTPFSFDDGGGSSSPSSGEAPAWLRLDDADEQEPDLGGSATEWLGANASQLIRGGPQEPGPPAWLRDANAEDATGDEESGPSWLQEAKPETPAAPEPPTNAAGDVPDWLQSDTPVAPSAPSADIPDWLRDEQPPAAPATPVPDWLQGEAETPAAPVPNWLEEEADTHTPAASGDMPAWLQDAAAPTEQPTTGDIPAWLQDANAPDAEAEAAEAPAWLQAAEEPAIPATPGPDIPASEQPDWLRAASEQPPIDSAPAAAEPPPERGDDLPPWLRDAQGEPLPTAGSPGDTNLPAWLRGIETSVPATPEPAEPEPVAPLSLDWFDEDTSTPEPAAAGPAASSELLGGADLPAWLRRETEAPSEAVPVDARSLEWLTKLGPYDDDTAVAATADDGPRLSLPQPPMPSAAHLEALALLQRLAANPLPQHEAREEQATTAWFQRIGGERVLYLLVLAALLAAMLVPGLTSNFQTPQVLPEADALHEQIAALGPDDIVLLGYEWDAQRISELRPLEQAVLSQLIEQRVKFVLVSTDPQGTLLQFDERDRLRAANYQEGGADYILLGYRPGNEFALRQLATNLFRTLQSDFQGLDATNGTLVTDTATSQPRLTHLNDFAMTIVMADEPNDVQAWMEQVRPSFGKPLVFLVPASVQPLAQPYFRQQNVFHLAGTNGALAYEQTRGGLTPATARQLGFLRLSTLIICGLLLIGIVIVLIRRMRSGEPQS